MADTYIEAEDVLALTEFAYVRERSAIQLQHYVDRAHIIARGYGPFPTVASLAGDAELQKTFTTEMKTALFVVTEGLILANPARPMAAAGITQERINQLNVSRAEGGGRSGKQQPTNVVPSEALDIFRFWNTKTTELLKAQRTDVFEPTHSYDTNDVNRKVVTREDIDDLSLELFPSRDPGGSQLFDADQ